MMPVTTCTQKREETKGLLFSNSDLMKRLTNYIGQIIKVCLDKVLSKEFAGSLGCVPRSSTLGCSAGITVYIKENSKYEIKLSFTPSPTLSPQTWKAGPAARTHQLTWTRSQQELRGPCCLSVCTVHTEVRNARALKTKNVLTKLDLNWWDLKWTEWLKQHFLTVLESGKFQIKMLADSILGKGPLLGLQTADFSRCPHGGEGTL